MDTGQETSFRRRVTATLRRHFASGILVAVPVVVTLYVLWFLFQKIDGLLSPLIHSLLGYSVPGMGLLATLLLIMLAGIVTRGVFGSRLFELGEILFIRTPLVRAIYTAVKQLVEAFTLPQKKMFDQVVLIEYPRKGVWMLAFVSSKVILEARGRRDEFLTAFVPSTPTPVTGWMVVVPETDVIVLDMSIEDAGKVLMSGGIASPEILREKTTVRPRKRTEELSL